MTAARNIAYGETDVIWQGPMFQSATQSIANGVASVVVTFNVSLPVVISRWSFL